MWSLQVPRPVPPPLPCSPPRPPGPSPQCRGPGPPPGGPDAGELAGRLHTDYTGGEEHADRPNRDRLHTDYTGGEEHADRPNTHLTETNYILVLTTQAKSQAGRSTQIIRTHT